MPDSVVFNVRLSDWTPDTVAFLKETADSCGQARHIRPELVEQAKAAIDEVATIPEKSRSADEKRVAEETKRKRIETCESTKDSALYNAQERVISGVEGISGWKENQAKEHRIAKVSGVRDLYRERANGEWLVELTDELNDDFAEYKHLGGKARSPQNVTHKLEDPCAGLR